MIALLQLKTYRHTTNTHNPTFLSLRASHSVNNFLNIVLVN